MRTHPDSPKHAGITTMAIDMRAAGVEVRPLREMTGEALFNEVFFNDVFVPDADVVGVFAPCPRPLPTSGVPGRSRRSAAAFPFNDVLDELRCIRAYLGWPSLCLGRSPRWANLFRLRVS